MNEDEENIQLNLNNNFGEIQDDRFGVSINSRRSIFFLYWRFDLNFFLNKI